MKNQDFNKQDQNQSQTTGMQKDKSSLADKVGGVIEKLGHKVSDMGAKDLGQKIHDAGDSIEKTHRNKSHPHDV